MDQVSFAEAEYENKRRKTRRELFLDEMEQLLPWKRLESKIKRHYAKGKTGRPPYPLTVMLRIHCLQLFYNLSDPMMEDSLYEIESMRRFAKLRLSESLFFAECKPELLALLDSIRHQRPAKDHQCQVSVGINACLSSSKYS